MYHRQCKTDRPWINFGCKLTVLRIRKHNTMQQTYFWSIYGEQDGVPFTWSRYRGKKQDRLVNYINPSVLGPMLLVIDEFGYLPFGHEEANLFFNVIAKRYEHGNVE